MNTRQTYQDQRQEFTRAEVEDFLYLEAALLDEWHLKEWLALLTEDAEYEIPATDSPNSDCRTTLALVYDNRERINSRVQQYVDGQVYAESPRSRVRRMISNVRILAQTGDSADVAANFVCYRFANERMDTFVGHLQYVLVRQKGIIKIRKRRIMLSLEALRPHCMLSIIL
jgi:p-cumate 2,3-dioxygenase beta subunit